MKAPKQSAGWALIGLLCTAQVLVQIGAFFWPALLPRLMPVWNLSNSEAGWITSAFYGAYMLAVPVLVTLTDRVDPKRIYLLGVALTAIGHFAFFEFAQGFWSALSCRVLAGIGWAGTYMTGLKLLADRLDPHVLSRATAGHAASIGVAGALSFATGEWLAQAMGWPSAFMFAGFCSCIAFIAIAFGAPRQAKAVQTNSQRSNLFDFRPVLRNRSAMAYAFVYGVHTLEMNALRGWAVAFLTWVALQTETFETSISPAMIVTLLALAGTVASVIGNELSIRFGRPRLVGTAMLISVAVGSTIGFVGPVSYWVAAVMVVIYGLVIWLDSSSLTAGTAAAADKERRGATLAVHSMLGYAGGFLGPLLIGWVLDVMGGASQAAWGASFGVIAGLMFVAFFVFVRIGPSDVEGDHHKE